MFRRQRVPDRASWRALLFGLIGVGGLCSLLVTGCLTPRPKAPPLAWAPDAFREELKRRVPELPERLTAPPFLVPAEVVERADAWIQRAPLGPARVEALVDFLSHPSPEGLGLVYDWSATGNAQATLELGRGNCVSLASVLVALGRGLGWPVYYAEARTREPEEVDFEQEHVKALSDHMVVIVAPRSFKTVVDFTGRLDEVEDLRPIDDLTAYAHILNNQAAQRLLRLELAPSDEGWTSAANGFRLATRIQPGLGRAWNNLGIALARLGRYEEAREAYERAVSLDTAFGSAARNLAVMETRALGTTTIRQAGSIAPESAPATTDGD